MLTGRFPRNPPLYYEMRLARVTSTCKATPTTWLHTMTPVSRAIGWVEGTMRLAGWKRSGSNCKNATSLRWRCTSISIATTPTSGHSWSTAGSGRAAIAPIEEVKRSRDEIAAAIKINPNAHYGREKYQLTAIEWIIDPPGAAGRQYLPNLLGWEPFINPVTRSTPSWQTTRCGGWRA